MTGRLAHLEAELAKVMANPEGSGQRKKMNRHYREDLVRAIERERQLASLKPEMPE